MRAPASWRCRIATRSAAKSVSNWRSSSLCTLSLLFLARDADAGPWTGVEPRLGDRVAAVAADPVGPLIDAAQRLFDRLEDLGVGLLQLELDVHLVVATGLVGHVALAPRVVLHRPLERLG